MEDLKTKIGDLVSIEPWDCEGIEMPYGHLEFEKRDWDPEKKKMFERLRKKVKIMPGSKALVTGTEQVSVNFGGETYYWCLVEGNQLIVSHRFISPV